MLLHASYGPREELNWNSKFTLGFRMALDHTVPHKASRDDPNTDSFNAKALVSTGRSGHGVLPRSPSPFQREGCRCTDPSLTERFGVSDRQWPGTVSRTYTLPPFQHVCCCQLYTPLLTYGPLETRAEAETTLGSRMARDHTVPHRNHA